MMINKGISVVIPAYNSEDTIVKCLEGIKGQSLAPLEIIVVDDNSTDKTAELARELAIVIPNTRRKGAAGARNTGVYRAQGEIIAFTDSDCIPPKDWLSNIASSFLDASVSAVGGGYTAGVGNNFWQMFCYEELKFRRKNLNGEVNTLVSNNFACRKSIFLEEQGFPEQYPVCEDMLLSYKISKRGKVIWLKTNGVQHHFKNTFKEYLRHQYYFGAESTRFFAQNPRFLFIDNHQSKGFHIMIILVFFAVLSVLAAFIFVLKGNFKLGLQFLLLGSLLALSHFVLYLRFIFYLFQLRFQNIFKAYIVSLFRDLVCGISICDGILRVFIKGA